MLIYLHVQEFIFISMLFCGQLFAVLLFFGFSSSEWRNLLVTLP